MKQTATSLTATAFAPRRTKALPLSCTTAFHRSQNRPGQAQWLLPLLILILIAPTKVMSAIAPGEDDCNDYNYNSN